MAPRPTPNSPSHADDNDGDGDGDGDGVGDGDDDAAKTTNYGAVSGYVLLLLLQEYVQKMLPPQFDDACVDSQLGDAFFYSQVASVLFDFLSWLQPRCKSPVQDPCIPNQNIKCKPEKLEELIFVSKCAQQFIRQGCVPPSQHQEHFPKFKRTFCYRKQTVKVNDLDNTPYKWDNLWDPPETAKIVASVKFDGYEQEVGGKAEAAHDTHRLFGQACERAKRHWHYPNRENNGLCRLKRRSKHACCYGLCGRGIPRTDIRECWAFKFRWELEKIRSCGIMLQVVEPDGELGHGQQEEENMAFELGIPVFTCHYSKESQSFTFQLKQAHPNFQREFGDKKQEVEQQLRETAEIWRIFKPAL